MSSQRLAILSTIVNFLLALGKLFVGLLSRSAALIADGIHSGLDIISSFITFLGIHASKKPADPKHPYGHLRYETAAGFVITFLLFISGAWIIYEGIIGINTGKGVQIGLQGLSVVVVSIIVNEIMARGKFHVGRREGSLSLVADAEHSRADSLSSVAVLIGLFLTRWFSWADSATAIVVGLFILFETYKLSREVVDDLLDISNPEIEKKINKICAQEEIDLLSLKTRKIGPQSFAELKIGLNPEWKLTRINEITKNLENLLIQEISSLKMMTIEVTTHEFQIGFLKSQAGQIKHFKDEIQGPYLKKMSKNRTIISAKNHHFHYDFGAPEYLVVDRDEQDRIVQKQFIKNPYYAIGRGHGMRFVRAIEPDLVITAEIGPNAKARLKQEKITIKLVAKEKKIKELL